MSLNFFRQQNVWGRWPDPGYPGIRIRLPGKLEVIDLLNYMSVSVSNWDTSVMDAKMDLSIWVNLQYSGESQVFGEKPCMQMKLSI